MNRVLTLLVALCALPALPASAQLTHVAPPALTGANPNGALNDIAFNDKQNVYLQVWGHPAVFGRFIDGNGNPLGAAPFLIAAQSPSDAWPRVIYSAGSDDDVFIVRFTSEVNRGQYLYVRTVRYTPEGPALGPIQLVSGSGSSISRAGGLAFNPTKRQILLTWETPALGWEVFGQLWQLSGTREAPAIAPATEALNISEMANAQGTPNVAYDWKHDNYLVVFRGEHPQSPFVYGSWARRLTFDANNAMTRSAVIELNSGFGEPAEQNVVYMPEVDKYLTFWTDITRVRDLNGRIVDDAGVPVGGVIPLLVTASNEGAADAKYSPYTRNIVLAAMREQTRYVQGVQLTAAGAVVDYFQATTAIPTGAFESFYPHVADGRDGRFAISYVNTYQFVYTELLGGAVAAGGHFIAPGGSPLPPSTSNPPPPAPAPPAPPAPRPNPVPRMNTDLPAPHARVPSNGFPVAGWAIDAAATGSTGVDAVHVWAYPTSGADAVWVGAADLGISRPDISAAFGKASFSTAGFLLHARLAPGTYNLAVFARSTIAEAFNNVQMIPITVVAPVSVPRMWVDMPSQNQELSQDVRVSGWAIDLASTNDSGVDGVHVWAYPTDGSPPIPVGVATMNQSRPDVGAAFGSSRFNNSGFDLRATMPRGTYTLVVFAHSSVANAFNNVFVIPVRVN